MPTISIITSTYNRSKKLERAIKSVLAQSYGDFEYLIIDDCSTDQTEKLVRKYTKKDKRIRYFKTEKNSGHDALPKNIGFKNATGEYIAFLDDDDEWFPDTAKILYKYMKHTKADMVYGDYIIYDSSGKKSVGWSLNFSLQTLTQFNYITTGCGFIKRDAILAVGGMNENVPRFKDWNLWLRLAKAGYNIIHIPIPTLKLYTMNDDSISKKYDKDTEYDEYGRYKATFFNPADCKIYSDKTVLGEAKPLKVALYTMTYNRLPFTKEMYKAINKISGYDFDWFVLDQGSTDGTIDWLLAMQDTTNGYCKKKYYAWHKENIGIAKGWNECIKNIKMIGNYDIVIKIDNDALMLTQDWLKEMVEVFERNRMVVLSPYVEGLEDSPGGVMRQRSDGESPYILINDKVMGMVPNLGGIVFATTLKAIEDFKFPEELQGNKDYYLSKYLQSYNYNLLYMEELRVKHLGGKKGQVSDYK